MSVRYMVNVMPMLSRSDLRRGLPDANMILLICYSSLRFSELTGLCSIVFFRGESLT